MHIRLATPRDAAAIWSIIGPVIRAGGTLKRAGRPGDIRALEALDRDMSEAEAIAYWLGKNRETFIAEDESGEILGTYYLKANQAGGGRHIANCGYMTSAAATGRGVARAMCAHSLEAARERGFKGMQFNFVVSTNDRAVKLWESMGFAVVGRLPGAFEHPRLGFVDALVMFREL